MAEFKEVSLLVMVVVGVDVEVVLFGGCSFGSEGW